jgi:Leucine-rich repeat (LRR) protein
MQAALLVGTASPFARAARLARGGAAAAAAAGARAPALPPPPSSATAAALARRRRRAPSASAAGPSSSAPLGTRKEDEILDDDEEDDPDTEAEEEEEEQEQDRQRQCRVRLSLAASTGRLDLSGLGLRGPPPPELWDLGAHLADLSLAGNRLTTLEGLGELSGLRRLAVAGNRLRGLPAREQVRRLRELEGLWAHGNLLRELPAGLFDAAAGGEDGEGTSNTAAAAFPRLRSLSLAGNRLASFPALAPGALPLLVELAAGGNQLTALPEGLAEGAPLLESVAAHGNALEGALEAQGRQGSGGRGASGGPPLLLPHAKLRRLSLQGNRLSAALLGDWSRYEALEHVNVADNGPGMTRLLSLEAEKEEDEEQDDEKAPATTAAPLFPPRLRTLTAYGNGLRTLPIDALAACAHLSHVWLEGNPLDPQTVTRLLEAVPKMPALKALGLDEAQVRGQPRELVEGAGAALRVGRIVGGEGEAASSSSGSWGPGYFKLVPARKDERAELLVVAYGSAPGEPNWGGALKRARREAERRWGGDDEGQDGGQQSVSFDVLYVVDPHRNWYWLPQEWEGRQEEEEEEEDKEGSSRFSYYAARVGRAAAPYRRVLLLGDSMGASGALMAAGAASGRSYNGISSTSRVLAFCPQADLQASAIRPGRPRAELSRWRDALFAAVRASASAAATAKTTTRIQVLTGTWQHDVDQARMLEEEVTVADAGNASFAFEHRAFPVDSHRLAAALASANSGGGSNSCDRLTAILAEAIGAELGLMPDQSLPAAPKRTGVRLANLL